MRAHTVLSVVLQDYISLSEFGCVLKLPTACTLKTEEIEVTYMNRGITYHSILHDVFK